MLSRPGLSKSLFWEGRTVDPPLPCPLPARGEGVKVWGLRPHTP